jgi:hypothetical protein
MSDIKHTPWRAHGTTVYFANNAGGFDVRACPDPEEKARLCAAAPDLLAELEAAHQIIRNALNLMSLDQQIKWSEINERAGLITDGATRANEREAIIAKAGGQP